MSAAATDGSFEIRGDDRAVLDAVRDAAVESGVGLRELRPAGPSLEDALIGAME